MIEGSRDDVSVITALLVDHRMYRLPLYSPAPLRLRHVRHPAQLHGQFIEVPVSNDAMSDGMLSLMYSTRTRHPYRGIFSRSLTTAPFGTQLSIPIFTERYFAA
ncbi:hypothetical protein [Burkholderia sp. IMCC1007]|uniref:hypothetical protein n=1 Tax=Burkholderia sp. IMCC1007 TaxID=3004104 RepID=UPI0022B39597|nr:hypothetical protein [Burkholderia sp. IMCC1007]